MQIGFFKFEYGKIIKDISIENNEFSQAILWNELINNFPLTLTARYLFLNRFLPKRRYIQYWGKKLKLEISM
jgi:hypothetical protein